MLVKAFDKQYAVSIELCKAALREHFYSILLDSKQGKYATVFYLHEARDPQEAHQLLKHFGEAPLRATTAAGAV